MVGVDEERIPAVIDIIKRKCKTRKKAMPNLDMSSGAGVMSMAFPVEVTVGGATVFVLNVEQFEKL